MVECVAADFVSCAVERVEIDRRSHLIQELIVEVDFYNKPK